MVYTYPYHERCLNRNSHRDTGDERKSDLGKALGRSTELSTAEVAGELEGIAAIALLRT
jgi:hypothetical protein